MADESPRRRLEVEDFLDAPPRDLDAWHWLWSGDRRLPVRRRPGLVGRLAALARRLLRPLFTVPQADLWDRQRTWNLILLEHLRRLEPLEDARTELAARMAEVEHRTAHLEAFRSEGVEELMAHNDALFSRVDQELDRQRRAVGELTAALGAAVARVEAREGGAEEARETGREEGESAGSGEAAAYSRALDERSYVELEARFRGTEEEIAERLSIYLPYLEEAKEAAGGGGVEGEPLPVLDVGCGRGEALALLSSRAIPAVGVDASERMVAHCRERGLEARHGDGIEALAEAEPESLAGVVSFHVVEHLPPAELARLVRLARRAIAPGGVLVLETPNALSLVAGARDFWRDPTHLRPVHPEALALLVELAGFETVEVVPANPFPEGAGAGERLPEIDLAALPEELRPLADRVNRLRDRLDELLFGYRDVGVVGRRPGSSR